MKIEETGLKDCVIIHPDVHGDNRGWFTESYHAQKYSELGIDIDFIQDNHSFSAEVGTLRGLHFQTGEFSQSKLVRCTRGKLYDVAVDLRKNSPTYLKSFGIQLSEDNHLQLFVPKGFAHGFVTLVENTEIQYKVVSHADTLRTYIPQVYVLFTPREYYTPGDRVNEDFYQIARLWYNWEEKPNLDYSNTCSYIDEFEVDYVISERYVNYEFDGVLNECTNVIYENAEFNLRKVIK